MGHTGAFHDELKADDARWAALAFEAYFDDMPDDAPAREQRVCTCGSSLIRPAADQAYARAWWPGYSAARHGKPVEPGAGPAWRDGHAVGVATAERERRALAAAFGRRAA